MLKATTGHLDMPELDKQCNIAIVECMRSLEHGDLIFFPIATRCRDTL